MNEGMFSEGNPMNAVEGTVRGGVVVLDEPNGFAEGMRVEVVEEAARASIGMREEDWPTTPGGDRGDAGADGCPRGWLVVARRRGPLAGIAPGAEGTRQGLRRG